MIYIKIDQPLDLVNIHRWSDVYYSANSPAPLRVCWESSKRFDSFDVGSVLAVTTEDVKPEVDRAESPESAGKLHTVARIHYVVEKAPGREVAISLSDFLKTVKRASSGKRGGYTGTPRKPEYGEGENMIARTITLPPVDWEFVDSQPGKNRSDKLRRLIENARTLPLGRLPT